MGARSHQDAGHGPPVLLAVVDGPDQALRALAEGADLIDASACTPRALAAIHDRVHPGVLWAGVPADPVDADRPVPAERTGPAGDAGPREHTEPAGITGPAGGAGEPSLATVVAVAAISTWLGAAAVRTQHVRAARRAIDMTAAIRGVRVPSSTVRGLA